MNKDPQFEDADNKLRDICIMGVYDKYTGDRLEDALVRIESELKIIKQQGSALRFITVINAFHAVDAKLGEYCLRGTTPSLLISYVAGLSDVDPLYCRPRLYPEFCYGINGDKIPWFEFNVSADLHKRLFEHFDNYPGDEVVSRKYDSKGQLIGVYMGGTDEASAPKSDSHSTFSINYVKIDNEYEQKKRLLENVIVYQCQPQTLEEYVKCYGFEHGMGVWADNAELLYINGKIPFSELIANREDLYEYLLNHDIDKMMAFSITEYVRKGCVYRMGWEPTMLFDLYMAKIPNWLLKSCEKIKYLFTRAHAISLFYNYMDSQPILSSIYPYL